MLNVHWSLPRLLPPLQLRRCRLWAKTGTSSVWSASVATRHWTLEATLRYDSLTCQTHVFKLSIKKKFSKISLILRVWWSQPVVKMELERVHQKMRERILCVNLNSTETELSFHIVVENDDKVLLLFAAWREAFLSQALLCRPLWTKRCKLTSLC